MAKKIIIALIIVMLTAGIVLLLFPTVSNFVGKQIANSEAEQFDKKREVVDNSGETFEDALEKGEVDKEGYPIDENGRRTGDTPVVFKSDLDRLLKDSQNYNENLKLNQSSLLISEEAYSSPALDMTDYGIFDGIYGYVWAPSIDLKLPVYLGANDNNLSCGAAHMTYTSLPLGGNSTNTVLAGHTGYVGRVFFDNLRRLKLGDTISLQNYWESIDYTVVKTEVKKPNDSQVVFITPDKDLLTMFTCISNGSGGFDRYYVICERA